MEELSTLTCQPDRGKQKPLNFFRKLRNQIGDKRVTHIIDYLTGESIDTIAKERQPQDCLQAIRLNIYWKKILGFI